MSLEILLATYNGEKYLREQLDSIINQDYKFWHLTISDDMSTDHTKDIIKEYIKNILNKSLNMCQEKGLVMLEIIFFI